MLEVPIPKIERGLPKPIDEDVQNIVLTKLNGVRRDFYLIMKNTGARPSEVKRLRVSDGWKEGVAITKTKTSTPRIAPWTDELRKVWKRLASGKNQSDFIFEGQNNFRSAMDRALRSINKERKGKRQPAIHVTPYQFRHTFATKIYNLSPIF